MVDIPLPMVDGLDLALREVAQGRRVLDAARAHGVSYARVLRAAKSAGLVKPRPWMCGPRGPRRKLGHLLTPEEQREIKLCHRCQNVHLYSPCEWCKYLLRSDGLVERQTRRRRKPRRVRRNWMHNPNPWGD